MESRGHPIQDGRRLPLLCSDCEQTFSVDEREFAERAFFQRHDHDKWRGFAYEEWLLRFAVGLAFKTAATHEFGEPLSRGERVLMKWAMPDWRDYLLGRRRTAGEYTFHLILMDYVGSQSGPVSANIQWYLMRSADMTYASSPSGDVCLYTLLPGFIFWVPLVPRRQKGWIGTRIRSRGERNAAGNQSIGAPGAWEFINERARAIQLRTEGTDRQNERMVRRLLKDPERVLGSKSFAAFEASQALVADE